MAVPSSSTRLALAIRTSRLRKAPSCASTIGMFSRRASSSIRARTGSRGGRRLSRNACSSSGTRTVFMSRRLRAAVSTWRDRLPGAHAFTAIRQDDLVELRGRQGLVKLRQASVQWLELRARQASLDLHHALAGVVEGSLVGAGPALEGQADLQAAGAGVMDTPV